MHTHSQGALNGEYSKLQHPEGEGYSVLQHPGLHGNKVQCTTCDVHAIKHHCNILALEGMRVCVSCNPSCLSSYIMASYHPLVSRLEKPASVEMGYKCMCNQGTCTHREM